MDEIVYDYYSLDSLGSDDRQWFFVTIVPKSYINSVIKIVSSAGIHIKNIISASTAIRNIRHPGINKQYVLINIGKHSTLISLVKGDQVVFTRDVEVGAENITRSMVGVVMTDKGKLEINYEKAEELKSAYGIPIDPEEYSKTAKVPGDKLLAMMRPALEKMEAEIMRTFAYYKEKTGDRTEFALAYFTGGGAKTKNLLNYFAEDIGFDASLLPVNALSDREDFAENIPFVCRAIGAALSSGEKSGLLPYEYRHVIETKMKKFVNFWSITAGYLLILLLIWIVFFVRLGWVQSNLKLIDKELNDKGIVIDKQNESQEKLLNL
ncbi:MAG: pilus assembly protein PilM, partial [bacterium]